MTTPIALEHSDIVAHAALRAGAVCFQRLGLHHLAFTGPKAADALTGLVTNHVLALDVGHGQYAAALTAKGRIVADLRVLRVSDERYLTTTGAAAWPGWRDLVRKFVNPRLAKYAEAEFETIAVHGPLAHTVVAHALAALGDTSPLATSTPGDTSTRDATPPLTPTRTPYAFTRVNIGDAEVLLIESPALGDIPGLDLLCPASLAPTVLDALTHNNAAVIGSELLWDVARAEAGRPAWGRDMDDTTIPQEANLGELGALSFDKGCYTGQETVARIHFRGHVNRHLRVITSSIPLPVPSELRNDDGKVIGDVRSSVISPVSGPLAIAMVRREIEPGAPVNVAWTTADGTETSTVAKIER